MSTGQQPPYGRTQDCTLTVSRVEVSGETLSVTYNFLNGSTLNAYLFNRLYRLLPDRVEIDPDLCCVEAEGEAVVVGKKIVRVPADVNVVQPYVPFVTRVRPYGHVAEDVSLSVPLKLWTPYDRPAAHPGTPAEAEVVERELWFELGFFLGPDSVDEYLKSLEADDGPADFFEPFEYDDQVLLRVGPLPEVVPLLLPGAPSAA